MGIVVVAKDRDALARRHTETVQIGAHRARHHHAGPVVAGEGDGPFMRARGEDRAPGDDAPEAFLRQVHRRPRQMQPDPFQRAERAAVIGPGNGGPGHQPDIGHRGQFIQHPRCPVRAGLARHLLHLGQKAAAHDVILFRKDHVRPRTSRRQRRHQARGAGADHQEVTEGIGLFIVVFVMLPRQRPKPRRPADRGFIKRFPELTRPHEGLVVKARAKERREKVIHRHQVDIDRRPGVLAPRIEARVDFLHRGADVRHLRRAAPDGDKRARLLRPRRHHAPRAVILEGPAKDPNARGKQRRGKRIALKAGIVLAVEAEANRRVAVHKALARDPHGRAPFFAGLARSAKSRASLISCVTVFRVTSIHAEQPSS